jgi:uncharacterized cupin superfamily protein
VHWDDVEGYRNAKGPMDATWQRLGDPAGAKGVGLNRVRIAPGKLSTPPHSHNVSEEIFFVLGGSGLLWQDETVCEVHGGDVIVEVADHFEHTFRAGDDGLDYVVFGTRHPTEYGWLPRSRALRIGYAWVEGRTDNPWEIETEIGELEFAPPGERPPNVVARESLELDEDGDAMLGEAAGSVATGLKWSRRGPGEELAIPHTHSAEEELFVILEGSGTLELWPSRPADAPHETCELRPGHVVARPPGTRVSHFITAGADGLVCLVYGTRDPNDICYYPRSNKIAWRGVGVLGRIEQLDYWDGER